MGEKVLPMSLFLVLLLSVIHPVCSSATEGVAEVRVAASSDDAEEFSSGGVKLTGSDLVLIHSGTAGEGDQTVGMRHYGVDIPRGAAIVSAYLQFIADEPDSVATSLTVQGEAVDNAATLVTTAGNISARPRTPAAVSWTPPPWTTVGEAGSAQRTPDITPIIQEIVSRPDWAAGNSLAIISTGTGEREAESFDGNHPEGAPLLHIVYDPLPPDPGEAGKATLEGIDSDGDGIRDDVQRYIALTYPDSEKTRKALTQLVVAMQNFILNSLDKEAALNNASAQTRALECLDYVRPEDSDGMISEIEAAIYNTEERIAADIAASGLLGGEIFRGAPLEDWVKSCNFNPDDLAN